VLMLADLCEGGRLEDLLAGARQTIEHLLWPHIVDELCAAYLSLTAAVRAGVTSPARAAVRSRP
jgi:hypothetical protein